MAFKLPSHPPTFPPSLPFPLPSFQDTLKFVQFLLDSNATLDDIIPHLEGFCHLVLKDVLKFANGDYMCPGVLASYWPPVSHCVAEVVVFTCFVVLRPDCCYIIVSSPFPIPEKNWNGNWGLKSYFRNGD